MRKIALLGLMFTLFSTSFVLAQGKEPVRGTFDVGPGWVGRNQAENLRNDDPVYYDLGIRFNRYLGDSQRLSFRFSFDYLGGGPRPFFDNWAEKRTVGTLVGVPVISDIGFLPNVGLAFDVVRIPHVNFALHGGVASLVVSRSASLSDGGLTANLCDYSEYADGCGIKGELLGNAGFSLRFSGHNFKKESMYAGIGYTAFTRNTRQIIVFIGGIF